MRARDIVLIAILLLASIVIFSQIVVRGLAAYAEEVNRADLDLALAAYSSGAASLAAVQFQQRGDMIEADSLARRALAVTPMDARALRVRAIAQGAEQNRDPGISFLLLAGQLGWRDTATQILLIQHGLSSGNYLLATQRADALLRRNKFIDQMMFLMRSAVGDPIAVKSVALRLMDEPPWRRAFMEGLDGLGPQQLDGQERLIRNMRDGGMPIAPAELSSLLIRQIANRDYQRAEALWRYVGKGSPHIPGNAVADGDFTFLDEQNGEVEGNAPFEWRLWSSIGASVRAAAPPFAPTDPALSANTDGTDNTDLAEQLVLLRPGHYRFAVDILSEVGDALDAFRWSIICLPSAPLDWDSTRRIRQGQWIHFEADFSIPVGCDAQLVKLRTQRATTPQSAQGWFDRVKISQR